MNNNRKHLSSIGNNKHIIATAVVIIIIGIVAYMVITNITSIFTALSTLSSVLSSIIYGIIIAYVANPIMKLCETKVFRFRKGSKADLKARRPLSVTSAMLALVAIVIAIFMIIIPQVVNSFSDLQSQFENYIKTAQTLIENFIQNFPLFNGEYETISDILNADEISDNLKSMMTDFSSYLQTATSYIFVYAGKFVVEVKNALIGIIVAFYLLLGKERIIAKIKMGTAAVFSRRHYLNLVNLMRYTDKTMGGFLRGKFIDSFIIGIMTFIVMSITKMPYAPLISVVIGITNVIPFFGPFIGAIPSAFIIFIANPKMTIWFIVMILVIQQLDGNIIGPKILSSSTGLSSLGVLVAITIAGGLFGFAGMILGVPIAAVICAIVRQYTEQRLRSKSLASDLDFYVNDPPQRDFSKQSLFLSPEEEIIEINAGVVNYSNSVPSEPADKNESADNEIKENKSDEKSDSDYVDAVFDDNPDNSDAE